MFQLSSAQSVRRDDLRSPASSPRSSPDPDLTELLRSRVYDQFTFTTAESGEIDDVKDDIGSDGEEAELVLFAGGSAAPQSQKIRLSSPGAAIGEPGFTVKRPRSYYFASEVDGEKASELQASAIDGAAVLQIARLPWAGSAMPWKVRTITPHGMKKSVLVGHPPTIVTFEDKIVKKKRKGKKTRIAMRKKLKARTGKEVEEERLAKERDEAEREKRTARNREKKLKKKAKDKAKKLAETGVVDAVEQA